jgi:hypothetical protein
MSTLDLNKIKLGYSPLSENIYLFRHGKKEHEALDKRDAEKDVLAVITEKMMHNARKGSSMDYRFGDQLYNITIKKVENENE